MKLKKIVFAAVVVMVVALISCGDAGGGGIPGIPDDLKGAAEIPPYSTDGGIEVVKNSGEAQDLAERAIGALSSVLSLVIADVYPKRPEGYEPPKTDYTEDSGSGDSSKEGSGTWRFGKDKDSWKEDDPIVTAEVEHSAAVSGSASSALIFNGGWTSDDNYEGITWKKDDWTESSGTWEAIFTKINYKSGKLIIKGDVTIEGSSESTQTVVAIKDDSPVFETVSSGSNKVSIAISVSDGSKAAKFIWSYDLTNNSIVKRSIEAGIAISDLKVYNNGGEELFSIDTGADYSDLALTWLANVGRSVYWDEE